jgi:hypothetical protein
MVSPKTKLELEKHANLHKVSKQAAIAVYDHFYSKIKQSPSKKNNKTIKERAIKKTHDFLRGCVSIQNAALLSKLDSQSQVQIKSRPLKC